MWKVSVIKGVDSLKSYQESNFFEQVVKFISISFELVDALSKLWPVIIQASQTINARHINIFTFDVHT